MSVSVQLLSYWQCDMTLSFGVYYIGDEGNHVIFDTIQRIQKQSGIEEAVCRETETHLDANNITDVEKKKALLLSCIGLTTYSLLTGWVAPNKLKDKLTDKSYNEIYNETSFRLLWFATEWNVQRFKFHTRTKRLGESVTSFVAELRPLAKYSNYASLKDLLRDRIVYCINDKCIHTKTSSVGNSCEAYLG